MKGRRYVLLDRDGTIIVERNYLSEVEGVELLPGSAAGLRRMSAAGFGLAVVTNQSGIGRGYFDEARVAAIHDRMESLLGQAGVRLDGIFVCPHTPDDGCECRKPRTGLVKTAALELGFDPAEAIVIGDKASDIELGMRLGARTVLVRTGYGAEVEKLAQVVPGLVANDLEEAASLLIDGAEPARRGPASTQGSSRRTEVTR